MTKPEQAVVDTRRTRDAITKVWQSALGALRRPEPTTDPQTPAATPNAA